MQIDILTTLPSMFTGPLTESILARAQKKGLVSVAVHDLRQWTTDAHKTTDDRPYGGGPGMVMMIEPIDTALKALKAKKGMPGELIILTSAKGELYTQSTAQAYVQYKRLVFICGHYEGVDERVAQLLVDKEVMVMVDSIVRLLPGALGDDESTKEESHSSPGYFEYPQYTRPEEYKGMNVPEVLLSGNHKNILAWRKGEFVQK